MNEDTIELSEVIEERLQKIANANDGTLTADAVVADAESSDSPLHSQFDWVDKVAGAKWRLQQARTLIRSVVLVVESTTTTLSSASIEVSAYVHDPETEGQGYRSIKDIVAKDEKETARKVVAAELSRADAALKRAVAYSSHFEKEMSDGLVKMRDNIAEMRDKLAA